MDTSERTLLAKTVRDVLTGVAEPGNGSALIDAALADLGWRDMLDAEPDAAIEIVFEALGGVNASASVLDDVMARALGAEPHDRLAVLLPPFATWTAPGRLDGAAADTTGVCTDRVTTADELLVACAAGTDIRVVAVAAAEVEANAVGGIDPQGGLHTVRVRAQGTVRSTLDAQAWETAMAFGRRALAHQIAGATRAMLELARAHALERAQFDRPVARFQAVRHRLAEALVAIEALDATLGAAADVPTPETAALAKAVAGRSARTVAAHSQQVLAGIGFTTDHPFHRYLKRTMVLDGLLGRADDIVVDLGHRLLRSRSVPTLVEL